MRRVSAHILSCPERAAVLANTRALLATTDWGDEARVSLNEDQHPDRPERIARGARRLLDQAVSGGADFILALEDDLAFNHHLRHNLQAWAPLAQASPDQPFFASLYDPGPPVGWPPSSWSPAAGRPVPAGARAHYFYGGQALLLSRAMARYVLHHWDEIPGHWDRKIAGLAERLGPIHRHGPSLVQHLGSKSLWGGDFHQAIDFDPLWKAGRDSEAQGRPLDETSAAVAFGQAATRARAERDGLESAIDPGTGAGVVIAAGGLRYFVNAWVCINMLRDKGCTLPIQLWHLGPDELPPMLADLVRPLGVECVDAHAQMARHPARRLFGWALKSYAILHAPFRHVLWLDADNVPLQDPTFILRSPAYQQHGAVFWPDLSPFDGTSNSLRPDQPIWRLTGLPYLGEPEFESGQLAVDKARCRPHLALARWMNDHCDFWYRFIYGDKDTFHLAWRKLGTAYGMIPHAGRWLEGCVLLQHDFSGRPLFLHRCADKWRLDPRRNRVIPGVAEEADCRRHIDRLRAILLAQHGPGHGRHSARLCGGRWMYNPNLYDVTVMTFLEDGRIGRGAGVSARFWANDDDVFLLLDESLAPVDRLRLQPAQGRWQSELRPGVSLTPFD